MATIRELQRGAARAKALADPTRLGIALALRRQSMYVAQMADVFDRDQSLISRHCAKLSRDGLAQRTMEHGLAYYALTDEGLAMVDAVMNHERSSRSATSSGV